jgi:dTDP-4-dehydrorhamnose reductase
VKLLVTGAGGMLGRAVAASAGARDHDVTALSRADLDVTDAATVRAAIAAAAPDVVVHCAAWTDVDGAEEHEQEALAVNGEGAGSVAAAAGEVGAFVVHVSTDYVFDGTKREPWVESDAVAPLGAYGRTKLAGERAVAAATPDHAIVRTAWLFGAGGRNFVDTMLALGAQRDEVSVVTDQVGCPTWTGHLADGLVALAERRSPGIQHLAGAGWCSWHDLAVEVFARAGVDVHVVPTTSDAFRRPAPRPAWSVLASERPRALTLPPWREGLARYLASRVAA